MKDRFIPEFLKLQSFKNKDYEAALREIFIKMDEMLKTPQGKKDIKKYSASGEDSQQSLFGRPETDNISLYTGCTACVCLITDDEIICANAGDSRCVLSVDGKAIEMSEDHKPDLSTEKVRIERAGGFVEDNRVKGVLNLSRSLGDLEYKQDTSIGVEEQMITCVPEIRRHNMTRNNEFVVIACDGIWDCLTSQECVNLVRDHFSTSRGAGNISVCIENMFDKIIASDVASSGGIGCDNMTAVIV